jgi:hypothetical protein
MDPRAVAIIEDLQPDKSRRNTSTEVYRLYALYELWNEDKHRNLPVLAAGLTKPSLTWEFPSGDQFFYNFPVPTPVVNDGAPLPCPANAVNVQLNGTVQVTVRVGNKSGMLPLVEYFENLMRSVVERVIDRLHPIAAGII